MSNRKIELSFEADKLILEITEEETELQSVNKILALLCKLLELLNRSSPTTKLLLAILWLVLIAALYIYKH